MTLNLQHWREINRRCYAKQQANPILRERNRLKARLKYLKSQDECPSINAAGVYELVKGKWRLVDLFATTGDAMGAISRYDFLRWQPRKRRGEILGYNTAGLRYKVIVKHESEWRNVFMGMGK